METMNRTIALHILVSTLLLWKNTVQLFQSTIQTTHLLEFPLTQIQLQVAAELRASEYAASFSRIGNTYNDNSDPIPPLPINIPIPKGQRRLDFRLPDVRFPSLLNLSSQSDPLNIQMD